MSVPRLRMLAGPNGSGKSTLFENLRTHFRLGHWLNPDKVERDLARDGSSDFARWGLTVDAADFDAFVRSHGLFQKLPAAQQADPPSVRANRLELTQPRQRTYFNSILCDYLRVRWLEAKVSFTFETVMSHPGKIDFFLQARAGGYRTYLYYICTDSPIINQERVANRVLTGGHHVDAAKIVERYYRSLELLPAVVRSASRAYLFDNSTAQGHRLVAEFHDGELIALSQEPPPAWAIQTKLLV